MEGFHQPQRQNHITEAATGGVLKEHAFLAISQNSQESTCSRFYFLIKLQALTSEKRDSGTSAFMWILWSFWEHLFYRTRRVTASAIMRRQNFWLQSTFLIKFYQPEENPAVSQISEKDVQYFLCSVVCILNSER